MLFSQNIAKAIIEMVKKAKIGKSKIGKTMLKKQKIEKKNF